jgi:hypothetical protein
MHCCCTTTTLYDESSSFRVFFLFWESLLLSSIVGSRFSLQWVISSMRGSSNSQVLLMGMHHLSIQASSYLSRLSEILANIAPLVEAK